MEAEDTVMNDAQIEKWLLNRLGEGNVFEQFNRQFCKDFAKVQAEISFKAGHEQRQAELRIEVGSIAFSKGKRAGLEEGIRLFAWRKDGIQYVGTGGTTLAEALKSEGLE